MKSFAVLLVFAQAAIFQTYGQILRTAPFLPGILPGPCGSCNSCGPTVLPPVFSGPSVVTAPSLLPISPVLSAPSVVSSQSILPLVPSNSVANNLADTLSLLTVSSLLAEALPLGYPNVLPVPVGSPYSCGCGSSYPYYF